MAAKQIHFGKIPWQCAVLPISGPESRWTWINRLGKTRVCGHSSTHSRPRYPGLRLGRALNVHGIPVMEIGPGCFDRGLHLDTPQPEFWDETASRSQSHHFKGILEQSRGEVVATFQLPAPVAGRSDSRPGHRRPGRCGRGGAGPRPRAQ